MTQVAYYRVPKALTTLSLVTFFAAGYVSDGATVYAQERKPATKVEAKATPLVENVEETEAMELPGIFKVKPPVVRKDAEEVTQKGSRPVRLARTSQSQFVADADKVTGAKLRRVPPAHDKPAPVVAALPKRSYDQAANDTAEIRKVVKLEAGKPEPKKILIPSQLASPVITHVERINPANFQATAYSLKGRTASGEYVRTGLIAADPKVLPLGTMVQIEAGKYSGVYKVADTGGAIKGNKIDIYVPTYREAKLFGRQKIKVTVLGKGKKATKS